MIALLLASAAVVIAAVVFAGLLRPRGAVAFVVATALLAQAIVVVTVGAVGLVIRSLSPATLLVAALAWVVVAGALAARRPITRQAWGARARGSGRTLRGAIADPPVAIAAALVVATLVWRTILALRLPVVDYDGWSYHLVFADVWLQHNALVLVPQRPWTAGYPADAELLTTWLMAFTRTDALAGFTSLLPIPLAIAATTGLARALGASPRRALLAGLVFGMTPALVALAGTTYVDAASVAVVAAALWLALRVIRGERDLATVLLLGLAAGLAIGTKGTNLVLVSPGLIAAGLVLLRDAVGRDRTGGSRGPAVARVGVLAVAVLALGMSWYAKNWIVYGNPLYPFAMGPFPGPTTLTEFTFTPPQLEGKGALGQLLHSWTADWGLRRYSYNVRPGGLGAAWPAILVIAAAGLVLLVRRRGVAPITFVLIPAAATLATMPMPWYARLTLFLPAVALPLAALTIDALRPPLAMVAGLALVAVATVSLTFANARPNIDIQTGTPPHLASVPQYVSFVLRADDARRANVSLRAECAGFEAIPPGSVVAPGGFNLLHGPVGPNLDRTLGDPLPAAGDPPKLAAALRGVGAGWLVTGSGGGPDRIASSAPDLFKPLGAICQGGRLYELVR
jgi:hypothetical protein